MNYDEKERLMITHYFGLLAENSFTEYDILGFLMVLRQELDSEKYKYIYDFANLIAHRSRNQGVAMDAIKGALSGKISLPTFLNSFLMKLFTILQSVCFRLPKTLYTVKHGQKRA